MTKLPSELKHDTILDLIKISMDIDKNDYPEIEVIEVPVVKRMIFQFKKPVKLEFS